MKIIVIFCLFHSLFSSLAAAETKGLRAQSTGTVIAGYELLSTWLPSKKLISYSHVFNEKWSLEGEYAWSTLDFPVVGISLGRISEKRTSVLAKYYPGNSFYYNFGAYLSDFEAQIGSDILTNISGARSTSSLGLKGAGVLGGIGNRWQWKNGFTLGVDWFRVNVPLIVREVDTEILSDISNSDDHDDMEKVIRAVNRLPTFVLLGLQLGYTF